MGHDSVDSMSTGQTNAGKNENVCEFETVSCFSPFLKQVWDGSSDAIITFNDDNFLKDVAYIVENDVLLFAILKEIEKCENVKIQNDSRIQKVVLQKDGVLNNLVYLQNGQVLSADLLVSSKANKFN